MSIRAAGSDKDHRPILQLNNGDNGSQIGNGDHEPWVQFKYYSKSMNNLRRTPDQLQSGSTMSLGVRSHTENHKEEIRGSTIPDVSANGVLKAAHEGLDLQENDTNSQQEKITNNCDSRSSTHEQYSAMQDINQMPIDDERCEACDDSNARESHSLYDSSDEQDIEAVVPDANKYDISVVIDIDDDTNEQSEGK